MSIFLPSQIGTDTNQIVFNDFTSSPVYRIQTRQPQRRQIRELDLPIPYESGISDFETLIGQTAYVIEGTMYPGSESEHATGLAKLRKIASLDIAQDDILSDNGYVPYQWDEFSSSKILYVKVMYVQIMESTRQGLVQPFRLICKVKDPTIHGSVLKQANTSQATPSTSTGSAVYSFVYPIVYGASTYSVTADAINDGDQPAYPLSITVVGPVSTPKVTNVATGEYIEVARTIGAGETLLIVYDKDTLTVTHQGVSVLNLVSATSTYFKLRPGSNPIMLSGSSISDGAYAVVSFRDAYPLS